MKPPLLFLCHRIPYPPNKGDKIRSWHVLRHLSAHYQIYLGAFIDEPYDARYVPNLEKICVGCHFVSLVPIVARFRSLFGIATGQPLTLPYYASRSMNAWAQKTIQENQIKKIFVYSSSMAQYVLDVDGDTFRRVIDFVDIDSDKWRQYGESKPWPFSWLYLREAKKLLNYEKAVSSRFDASLFVSEVEAKMFRQLVPENDVSIGFYKNGVNANYFSPEIPHSSPFPDDENVFVFTGAMDYWPNVDAVTWFAKQIFPLILNAIPAARFYIVGVKPSESVKALQNIKGIFVTGRVEDVRPYLLHSKAVVVPMRVARGIQNKVLEAMAMAKPVIVSPQGLEGINAESDSEVLIAEKVNDYVSHAVNIVSGCVGEIGNAARARVIADFNWDENVRKVSALIS